MGIPADEETPLWGHVWHQARVEMCGGIDNKCPLMPRGATFARGVTPMGATEVTKLLRDVLTEVGTDSQEFETITRHSCKQTVLSWICKASLKMLTRRRLGGHAKSDMKKTGLTRATSEQHRSGEQRGCTQISELSFPCQIKPGLA